MNVFVAGGSGAVGRQLIPQLIAAGHTVVATTRTDEKAEGIRRAGAEAVVCDVFDRDRLVALVGAASPDAVINQLTDLPASMNPRRLEAIYEKNDRVRRVGTRNLLEAAAKASVQRFVAQSIAFLYAPTGDAIKHEADPLWVDAPEPFGTAVRTVEAMEAMVLERAPIGIVLRYGGFYGPGTWYAPDGEVARRVRARQFPIIGRGDGVLSFIHVGDAAAAAVAALSARSSSVYNVVDDEPAPASEWIPAYAKAIGAPPPRHVPRLVARLALGKAMTAWLTSMRGASNAKIAVELGWRPREPSWRAGFLRP